MALSIFLEMPKASRFTLRVHIRSPISLLGSRWDICFKRELADSTFLVMAVAVAVMEVAVMEVTRAMAVAARARAMASGDAVLKTHGFR